MYTQITHPNTGLRYSTDSKMGKSIIINYIQQLTGGDVAPPPPTLEGLRFKFAEAIRNAAVSPNEVSNIVGRVNTLLKECPDKSGSPSVCWEYVLDQGMDCSGLQIFSDWGKEVVDIIMAEDPLNNIASGLGNLEFGTKRGMLAIREVVHDLDDFIAAKRSFPQVGGAIQAIVFRPGRVGKKCRCLLITAELFSEAVVLATLGAAWAASHFIGGDASEQSPQDSLALKLTDAIHEGPVPPKKIVETVNSIRALLKGFNGESESPSVFWEYALEHGVSVDDLQLFSDWGKEIIKLMKEDSLNNKTGIKLLGITTGLKFGNASGMNAIIELLRDLDGFAGQIASTPNFPQDGGGIASSLLESGNLGPLVGGADSVIGDWVVLILVEFVAYATAAAGWLLDDAVLGTVLM